MQRLSHFKALGFGPGLLTRLGTELNVRTRLVNCCVERHHW